MNYPTGTAIRFKKSKPKLTRQVKRQKYHAKKVTIDGMVFDSKAEGAYYLHLKNLKLDFKIHEPFTILDSFNLEHPKKHVRACKYTPDFSIYEHGKLISVVDVKGNRATLTEASRLRMKIFMSKYKVPVVIATLDYRTGIFQERVK